MRKRFIRLICWLLRDRYLFDREILIENAKTYERNGNYEEAYRYYILAALQCKSGSTEREHWSNTAEGLRERF